MPLLSVIIPVYNAGHNIYRLLDSLINQTMHDIEFICVVDCPTDGSDHICMEYAKKDKRIKLLINPINIGIAASRNRGIEEAIKYKSKYIGFADHDDYLECSAYERLMSAANNKGLEADVVFANSFIENKYSSARIYFNDPSWEGMIRSLLLPQDSKYNPNFLVRSVWNSVYKTSFIEQNTICFKDRNLYLEEDTLFNLEVYIKTKNITYLNSFVYHWVIHETSTSAKLEDPDEVSEKMLRYLIHEWSLLSTSRLYEFRRDFQVMVSFYLREYYFYIKIKNKEYKNALARLLHDCSFPIIGRYENLKLFSKKRLKLLGLVFWLKYFSVE